MIDLENVEYAQSVVLEALRHMHSVVLRYDATLDELETARLLCRAAAAHLQVAVLLAGFESASPHPAMATFLQP